MKQNYILLDMDGTIYLGDHLIPGAKEFLEAVKASGKRYLFLTNNSSKNRMDYVEKLNRLGIHALPNDVFTSGEATAIYLQKKYAAGTKLFLLGTSSLEEEMEAAGFYLVKTREELSEVKVVVLGFDTTLTYEKLWLACDAIRDGKDYIATHPDLNCPLEAGAFMPDAGAMIAFIEASTGQRPLVIGKPEEPILESICQKYDVRKEELLMVGDRLYTDIAMGAKGNIKTCLVLTGETRREEYEDSPYDADLVLPSVRELIEYL